MTSEDLTAAFRGVLLRHSRSLVDHDGQPTDAMLAELVAVALRHAGEQVPVPAGRRQVRRQVEPAEFPA